MNQARIWLVVNPTVGLPLFLGSVTGIALLVHYSVLTHTTWFADYWQGGKKVKAATETSAAQQVGELVLPNGAKVKFSIEDATPRQLEASVLPESLTSEGIVANASSLPVADPPSSGGAVARQTASRTE